MNGPVLMANVIYRCSMLMDDLQRFISWYMHVAPAVVVFALRWLPHDERFDVSNSSEVVLLMKYYCSNPPLTLSSPAPP